MAGESLPSREGRATPVRPGNLVNSNTLQPITEEFGGASGDKEDDQTEEQGEQPTEWEVGAEKDDDVTRRVSEYLENGNGAGLQLHQ